MIVVCCNTDVVVVMCAWVLCGGGAYTMQAVSRHCIHMAQLLHMGKHGGGGVELRDVAFLEPLDLSSLKSIGSSALKRVTRISNRPIRSPDREKNVSLCGE